MSHCIRLYFMEVRGIWEEDQLPDCSTGLRRFSWVFHMCGFFTTLNPLPTHSNSDCWSEFLV